MTLAQFLPSIIMFIITTIVVAVFCVPAIRFRQKSDLLNFYWVGFWVFLIMIASISGSMNTLKLMNYDATLSAETMLSGIVASFVFFVMFAWFRLAGKGLITILNRGLLIVKVEQ